MDIIIITILLITTLLSFAAFYIAFSDHLKIRKNKIQLYQNNVHFYVARDKNGTLWLYMGKPFRDGDMFCTYLDKKTFILTHNLEHFNLKYEDYNNLKWEDEPVEVFLNLGD